MSYTENKVGIICPLDDDCDASKELLGLHNESEVSGRIVSERKKNNVKVVTIKSRVDKNI